MTMIHIDLDLSNEGDVRQVWTLLQSHLSSFHQEQVNGLAKTIQMITSRQGGG